MEMGMHNAMTSTTVYSCDRVRNSYRF